MFRQLGNWATLSCLIFWYIFKNFLRVICGRILFAIIEYFFRESKYLSLLCQNDLYREATTYQYTYVLSVWSQWKYSKGKLGFLLNNQLSKANQENKDISINKKDQ